MSTYPDKYTQTGPDIDVFHVQFHKLFCIIVVVYNLLRNDVPVENEFAWKAFSVNFVVEEQKVRIALLHDRSATMSCLVDFLSGLGCFTTTHVEAVRRRSER